MPRHGDDETGWLRAQLARVTAERDQLQQHLDARAELDRALMAAASAPAADGTGPLPAVRSQGPRTAGHRTPKDRTRTHLRVVRAVAFLTALSGLGLKGRVARGAARVALAALVTGPTISVAVSPGASAHEHPPASASVPGWGTTATPIPDPSSPAVALVTRPKNTLDAKSADSSPPAVTVLPWYDYPPASAAPASPQPSASPSSPAAPAAGILTADTADGTQQIDLGPAAGTLTTAINLSASGGDVTWGAIPRLGRDARAAGDTVTLDSDQGQVSDGGSGAISVTIGLTAQDNGGTVTVKVWGGSGQAVTITISWEPAPAPTPSPADVAPAAGATDMPSPAAS